MQSHSAEASLVAPPAAAAVRVGRGVIYLLTLAYVLNMLDRQVITILVEPMKHDLKLADWQVGAVSGLAFALLYTTAGIPLARFADKGNRVWMIAASLAVWSVFTMACGATRGFGQMLGARIGVGVGEAGCTPAAHSFISDYIPRERRGSALATYSLGTPLGALLGLAIGGLLLGALGWRGVFVAAGLPGVILALVVVAVLRDPRHAAAHAQSGLATPSRPPLSLVLRTLARKRAFCCICLASGAAAFAYFGQSAFLGSLYLRTHAEALKAIATSFGMAPASLLGIVLGVLVGVCGCVGTVLGGLLADRMLRFGLVAYARLPVATLMAAMPFFALAVLVDNLVLSFVLLGAGFTIFSLTYASSYAAVQTLAEPRMRAMASAIQLFVTNAVGLAFGPLFVGWLSDHLLAPLGPVHGLRVAMAAATGPLLIASLLFWLAGRTIVADEAI
jgi:MFS family permease